MLEQRKQAPVYTNWLEGYNMSITGEEKKRYLDLGLAEDASPENLLRKKLWEVRYTQKGKVTGYDSFMALWMELGYEQKQMGHFFFKGRTKKKMMKLAEGFMFSEGTTEALQDVLFKEYVNLVAVYISLCQKDKNYKSIVLGVGTMKDESLLYKIAEDVYNTGCGAAILSGMTEQYELLMRASKAAFLDAFPQDIGVWNAAEEKFRKKHGLE